MIDFLKKIKVYEASRENCFAFRRGTDVKDGYSLALGNMVSGFPFELEGVAFPNSECAYIAGLFSDGSAAHIDLQRRLTVCTNGLMAKRAIRKPNRHIARKDWEEFNVQWMLYVVWGKCVGNADFRRLLLSLPNDAVIIEDSTFQAGETATFWGTRNALEKSELNTRKKALTAEGLTKAEVKRRLDAFRLGDLSHKGQFVGCNVMGKILMLCRMALQEGSMPIIDYNLLRSKRINLLGKVLNFPCPNALTEEMVVV